jgi:O-antigen chain-terminating methyltransferase
MANAEEQTSGMNDALSCIASLHEQLRDTEQQARAAEQQANALALEKTALLEQLRDTEQRARAAEQQANALALEKTALLESLSWRITRPLRFVGGWVIQPTVALRRLANGLLHSGIETFQRPLAAAMRFVLRHSALSHRLNQRLMRYPALYRQLLGVARRHGATAIVPPLIAASATKRLANRERLKLTPRACRIYDDLKAAIDPMHGKPRPSGRGQERGQQGCPVGG